MKNKWVKILLTMLSLTQYIKNITLTRNTHKNYWCYCMHSFFTRSIWNAGCILHVAHVSVRTGRVPRAGWPQGPWLRHGSAAFPSLHHQSHPRSPGDCEHLLFSFCTKGITTWCFMSNNSMCYSVNICLERILWSPYVNKYFIFEPISKWMGGADNALNLANCDGSMIAFEEGEAAFSWVVLWVGLPDWIFPHPIDSPTRWFPTRL